MLKPVILVISLLALAACETSGTATNQTKAFEEGFINAGS